MRKFITTVAAGALVAALGFVATPTIADGHAAGWVLDSELSNISFGSIKNDYVGESHTFGKTSGTVTGDGMVTIKLGLGSVETNIDIRNERMREFVFNNAPNATITAAIDMAELNALPVGGSTNIETEGTPSGRSANRILHPPLLRSGQEGRVSLRVLPLFSGHGLGAWPLLR